MTTMYSLNPPVTWEQVNVFFMRRPLVGKGKSEAFRSWLRLLNNQVEKAGYGSSSKFQP